MKNAKTTKTVQEGNVYMVILVELNTIIVNVMCQHLQPTQQANFYLKNLPLLFQFHKSSDPKLYLQTNWEIMWLSKAAHNLKIYKVSNLKIYNQMIP